MMERWKDGWTCQVGGVLRDPQAHGEGEAQLRPIGLSLRVQRAWMCVQLLKEWSVAVHEVPHVGAATWGMNLPEARAVTWVSLERAVFRREVPVGRGLHMVDPPSSHNIDSYPSGAPDSIASKECADRANMTIRSHIGSHSGSSHAFSSHRILESAIVHR